MMSGLVHDVAVPRQDREVVAGVGVVLVGAQGREVAGPRLVVGVAMVSDEAEVVVGVGIVGVGFDELGEQGLGLVVALGQDRQLGGLQLCRPAPTRRDRVAGSLGG